MMPKISRNTIMGIISIGLAIVMIVLIYNDREQNVIFYHWQEMNVLSVKTDLFKQFSIVEAENGDRYVINCRTCVEGDTIYVKITEVHGKRFVGEWRHTLE